MGSTTVVSVIVKEKEKHNGAALMNFSLISSTLLMWRQNPSLQIALLEANEIQLHAEIWSVAASSELGVKVQTWLIRPVPSEQRWNVIFETRDSSEMSS